MAASFMKHCWNVTLAAGAALAISATGTTPGHAE